MSDEMPRSSVSVRIAGEEHTIRANAAPEYTRRCAEFVDERIREIQRKAGAIELHKAAILAALSITDECFQAREELDGLEAEIARRGESLSGKIEEALGAGGSPG